MLKYLHLNLVQIKNNFNCRQIISLINDYISYYKTLYSYINIQVNYNL